MLENFPTAEQQITQSREIHTSFWKLLDEVNKVYKVQPQDLVYLVSALYQYTPYSEAVFSEWEEEGVLEEKKNILSKHVTAFLAQPSSNSARAITSIFE